MKQSLIEVLSTYKYPVILQGSLAPGAKYPESFFTIWNSDTYDGNYYDNRPASCVWNFSVCFYSVDPSLVNTQLATAVKDLRDAGWIIDGCGYDAASDEPTHTGRAVDVLFLEIPKKEEPET